MWRRKQVSKIFMPCWIVWSGGTKIWMWKSRNRWAGGFCGPPRGLSYGFYTIWFQSFCLNYNRISSCGRPKRIWLFDFVFLSLDLFDFLFCTFSFFFNFARCQNTCREISKVRYGGILINWMRYIAALFSLGLIRDLRLFKLILQQIWHFEHDENKSDRMKTLQYSVWTLNPIFAPDKKLDFESRKLIEPYHHLILLRASSLSIKVRCLNFKFVTK